MCKCRYPDGIVILPDGENELDPCVYEVERTLKNVTIQILRCKKCGHMEISWVKQLDTIEIPDEEFFEETL